MQANLPVAALGQGPHTRGGPRCFLGIFK